MKLRSILNACSLFAVLSLLVLPMIACAPEEEAETEVGDVEYESEEGEPTEVESDTVDMDIDLDDAGITAAIKTRLAADPDVGAFEIDVDTQDGVVTLSGDVEQAGAVEQAEAIARNQAGVVDVINNLTTDLSEEID